MHTLPRLLAAATLLAAACSPAATPTASPSGAPASPGASPGASPTAAAVRPLIVDTDLGSDDILALAVVLREPSVDVRAITVSGTGLVHCGAGLRNLRLVLAAFGAGDIPIGCGREVPGPAGRAFPDEWRAGSDALYGVGLPPAAGTSLGEDARALIARAASASPVPPTILALGPWTNLADAFAADPALPARIAGIHAMAGTVDAPGNVELGDTTAADGVEWNVGADPDAFAAVLALDVPVTLVPLDATDRIPVPADVVDRLAPDHAAAGADIAWELYLRNPFLTGAGNFLWDPLAALTLADPGLVTWSDATLAMTAAGRQAGRLVRDAGGRAVHYASSSDPGAAIAALFAALRRGAARPQPLVVNGELHVTWDGSSCRVSDGAPARAGTAVLRVTNAAAGPAYVLEVTVTAPKSWTDLATFLATFDPAAGEPPPAWLNQVAGSPLDAGAETVSIGTLPAGEAGGVCATGELPDLAIRISEPVTVGP